MEDKKLQLKKELEKYRNGELGFSPYYKGMNILSSALYKEQLQAIIALLREEDESLVKTFKMYLDTIIINMHTKVKKYKQSLYIEDENVKDIENQGYHIPFYIDEKRDVYVLLGIVKIQP